MERILIIDDDITFSRMLMALIRNKGHEAVTVHDLAEGLEKVQETNFDIVFLDVNLPDGNGLEILPILKKSGSWPEVLIITAMGDHNGAKLAIENGAWDFIQKGDSFDRIKLSFRRVLNYIKEKKAINPVVLKRGRIIGESPALLACLDLVAQTAVTDINALITGPTGTGKELFARSIHENSSRSEGPFIVVDCTVIPESLVESTLFGHEKGAFTGADTKQEGLISQADKGTLFLDEIGELSLSIQKSFLRVLQERKFRALGGREDIESDFRLISATNRNPDQMVNSNTFREDLLYRLRTAAIHLPALSQRPGDIRILARHYLDKICERAGADIKSMSPAFFETLEAYQWPGNVRELIHVLESAFAASFGNTLIPQHLPAEIRINAIQSRLGDDDLDADTRTLTDFKTYLKAITREYLQHLISLTKGDIRMACRISGLSRSRLYDLLKEYRINYRQKQSKLL